MDFLRYFSNFVVQSTIIQILNHCRMNILKRLSSKLFAMTVVVCLCTCNHFLMAAGQQADSLLQVLETARGASRIDILIRLCEELKNVRPEQALEYGQQAIDLAEDMGDSIRIGRSAQALAGIYLIRTLYNKSLEYLFLALETYEGTGSLRETARCCNDIGTVYMAAGDYRNADSYFQRAVDINRNLRDYGQIVVSFMKLGTSLTRQDSVEKGLSYFLVSKMIADSLNIEGVQIELMNNIGLGYEKIGRYNDALQHFYKVRDLLGEKPDPLALAGVYVNIASSYYHLRNFPAAMHYAFNALSISRPNRFNIVTRDATKILSDVYAAQNNYQLSYKYLSESKSISDTILTAEKAEQLSRIQALYELNNKEKEIASLKSENQKVIRSNQAKSLVIFGIAALLAILGTLLYVLMRLNKRYRALNWKLAEQGHELEKLNDQKDRFFSFVAHNLKNPFNTIMGFAELMQRCSDTRDFDKTRQYSALIYSLSAHVQKVLSNLLEWSRLQRRNFEYKPETIELTSLLKDVLEMNNKEAARKDLHLELVGYENIYVQADRAMITTVLQNLISNAINYTPPAGQVLLKYRKKGNDAEIIIADNGLGISREDIPKLFQLDAEKTKIGTGENKGAGLGLIICKEMLLKNGGDITVKSEPGIGSQFIFTLPLTQKNGEPGNTDHQSEGEFPPGISELLHGYPSLSKEARADLSERIVPAFNAVSKILSLDNLDHFARVIQETGERHHQPAFVNFGMALAKLIRMHQIDQIIKILPRFKDFLNNLGCLN